MITESFLKTYIEKRKMGENIGQHWAVKVMMQVFSVYNTNLYNNCLYNRSLLLLSSLAQQ